MRLEAIAIQKTTVFSKTLKIAPVAVLLAAIMLVGQAKAVPILVPNPFSTPGLPGTVRQGDKIYSDFSNPVGGFSSTSNTTTIKEQTISPGTAVHTVTFGGLFTSDTEYDIFYSITITGAGPSTLITAVGVGIDQSFTTGTGGTAEKIVWSGGFNGTLLFDQTVTGSPGTTQLTIPGQTQIFIEDIIKTDAASVNSVSNTIIETGVSIPEPGTLSLLGLALAGAGVISRRRRTK